MSTYIPMASLRAYRLADAVTDMALRYAEAERNSAYSLYDEPARIRWNRASQRRLKAMIRLTNALRDLPFKEEQ